MVTIVFEAHATSLDNEKHISSGHCDVELSELGLRQSKELGERYSREHFDTIFCSDLQRSYRTAELAFGNRSPIIKDARLRECDYGDYAGRPSKEVEPLKVKKLTTPFPNGESYEQAVERMYGFLSDLLRDFDGKIVMIIGHRATQYGLEYWIKGAPLLEAITAPWKWQPGWIYELKSIKAERV